MYSASVATEGVGFDFFGANVLEVERTHDEGLDFVFQGLLIVHLKFQVSVGFRREKRRGTVPHQGAGRQNNPSIIAVQMGFHG